MSSQASSIPAAIRDRTSASAQPHVWTPEDFADLGPRTAVDQALHRLVASKSLRRRDPNYGQAIEDDLRSGLSALPEWMRVIVRDLLQQALERRWLSGSRNP